MTEVLEHLEEPGRGLAEAHRLLRPGGGIILTTPLVWPLHEEPRDFYRFTPYGLRHLLGRAGFEAIEVRPLSGQWTTLAMLGARGLRPYRRGALRPLLDAFLAARQALAIRLDEVDFRPELSWNHVAVARKP